MDCGFMCCNILTDGCIITFSNYIIMDNHIATEAILLRHSIEIRSLEEVLEQVCFAAKAKFGGKTFREHLDDIRDKNLKNILRTLADRDPNRASEISKIFEADKQGKIPPLC